MDDLDAAQDELHDYVVTFYDYFVVLLIALDQMV